MGVGGGGGRSMYVCANECVLVGEIMYHCIYTARVPCNVCEFCLFNKK